MKHPPNFDRPFPQDIGAERALLGGILLEPSEILTVSSAVAWGDFYRPEHAALWRLLLSMADAREPIDLVTVAGRVLNAGAAAFGGAGYVAELPEHCPATTNLLHYAEGVRSKAIARRTIAAALEIAEAAFNTPDASALVQGGAAKLASLAVVSAADWSIGDAVEATEREDDLAHKGAAVRARMRAEGLKLADLLPADRELAQTVSAAIPTGFPQLDAILDGGGIPGGKVTVIGGATSMGKSSLARAIELHMAQAGVPVGHFSVEEQRPEWARKVLSDLTHIPLATLRQPERSTWDTQIINGWVSHMKGPDWRLKFTFKAGATLAQIATQARRWKLDHGIEVLVVDYLQAIATSGRTGNHQDYGAIVDGLAVLGGELGVAVVLLSQITREGQKERKGPKGMPPHWPRWFQHALVPRVFDLKESGSIENVADLVLFPVRADIGGIDRLPCEDGPPNAALIKVAKQKNGPLDMVPCEWDAPCASYRPIDPPDNNETRSDLL